MSTLSLALTINPSLSLSLPLSHTHINSHIHTHAHTLSLSLSLSLFLPISLSLSLSLSLPLSFIYLPRPTPERHVIHIADILFCNCYKLPHHRLYQTEMEYGLTSGQTDKCISDCWTRRFFLYNEKLTSKSMGHLFRDNGLCYRGDRLVKKKEGRGYI